MLRDEQIWENYQKIAVYHGVRRGAHLAYREELEALEAKHPGRFLYLPTVSREEVAGTLHGRITTTWEEAVERVGAPIDPETTRFMLCGSRAMLDDMTRQLGELGMTRALRSKPGQIHSEVYF